MPVVRPVAPVTSRRAGAMKVNAATKPVKANKVMDKPPMTRRSRTAPSALPAAGAAGIGGQNASTPARPIADNTPTSTNVARQP